MRQLEAMYAWNPGTDQIEVGAWPDRSGWSKGLRMSGGACYADVQSQSAEQRLTQLFIDFNTCVVRDKVPAEVVHQAFLKIDEYRARIAPDTPGAEQ